MNARVTLFFLVSLASVAPLTGSAAAEPLVAVVSVTGNGEITAAPDSASFRVGSDILRASAGVALAESNRAIDAIRAQLRASQVPEDDVQTVQFSVSPQFSPGGRGSTEPPPIVGYRVTHVLSVSTSDLERLGELLDRLLGSGATVLDSVQFGVRDPSQLLDQARARAVQDAMHRARVLAEAAGRRVGAIRVLQESGGGPVRPLARSAFALQSSEAVPIAYGETEIRSSVTIEFALE